MRLITLIYNQNNPRLFSDHVNRLDCLRKAEILICNIQLHLRNTDFSNICFICRSSKTYYELRFGFVINRTKNNKTKKQQIAVFWLCNSNVLDLSLKTFEKYKDPFLQLTIENICFLR